MQVIAHKRMTFHRADVKPHPRTGENMHLIHESHTVVPSVVPQEVPNWIKDDGLFELAVEDGSLIPVAVLAKPEKQDKKAAKQQQQQTGLPAMGWGAKAN